MVVNNLLIKVKDSTKENIAKVKDILSELKGNIPVLLDSRVELDIHAGESPYDIMLINTFKSYEDIKTYLDHPVHIKVSQYITGVIEKSASLCYEVK
jgi:hypothetical protein